MSTTDVPWYAKTSWGGDAIIWRVCSAAEAKPTLNRMASVAFTVWAAAIATLSPPYRSDCLPSDSSRTTFCAAVRAAPESHSSIALSSPLLMSVYPFAYRPTRAESTAAWLVLHESAVDAKLLNATIATCVPNVASRTNCAATPLANACTSDSNPAMEPE